MLLKLIEFIKRHKKTIFIRIPALLFVAGLCYVGYVYIHFLINRDKWLGNLESLNLQIQERATGKSVYQLPTKIFDKTGEIVIGEYGGEKRKILPFRHLKAINKFSKTLIASEDRDFYNHKGYSPIYLVRAFLRTVVYGHLSGGSTITQQLAKLLFTDASRSISRKLLEILCAREIEKRYAKDFILIMYLNKIYFGHHRFGLSEAARFYFGKKPMEMTWPECAMLTGIIPNPTAFSPARRLQRAMFKQRLVLKTLISQNVVSKKIVKKQLINFFRRYKIPKELQNRFDPKYLGEKTLPGKLKDQKGFWKSNIASITGKGQLKRIKSAFFNEYVRQFIVERLGKEKLKEGLTVFTTIDALRQDAAYDTVFNRLGKMRAAIEKRLQAAKLVKENEKQVTRLDKELNGLNAAMVTINHQNGFVEVLVGGYRFSAGNQLNRAMRTRRQTGSVIKPFVYYTALDNGKIKPTSMLLDEKVTFGKYSPKNWYSKPPFRGAMSVRQALAQSVNTIAVKTLHSVGTKSFLLNLQKASGIESSSLHSRFGNDLSMALGSKELSVLELCTAYATLASGGRYTKPVLILKILDKDHNLLFGQDPYKSVQVLDHKRAFQVIQLMQAVVSDSEGSLGYLKRRRKKDPDFINIPIAGKTGSTQISPLLKKKFRWYLKKRMNTRDAWFVGLTSRSASVVWVGNDHGFPFRGGGSTTAAPIWVDYMGSYLKKLKKKKLKFEKKSAELIAEIKKITLSPEFYNGDTGAQQRYVKLLNTYPGAFKPPPISTCNYKNICLDNMKIIKSSDEKCKEFVAAICI